MKKTRVDDVSDRDLGLLYGHLNPHVVGSYRARVTADEPLFGVDHGTAFLLMGITVGVITHTSSLPDFAALETVVGSFDDCAENGDGDAFAFLGKATRRPAGSPATSARTASHAEIQCACADRRSH
ncbi:MAG: hypothetical protein MZW92_02555 [Comamonadaceae bacterium]|nr:hypothetical protein [Comamonadaceae bacterium]